MISVRRILGLLALAGTIGLGAESRAQAQTDQPENPGVAPEIQKLKFAGHLLGQERPSISQETTLIRGQDQVLNRLGGGYASHSIIPAHHHHHGRPPATPYR
jgi:hypothetical protein